VSEVLTIPTVGIGAGASTDAQVIVWQDMAGLTPDPVPRFVRRYADLRGELGRAARAWADDVTSGAYPAPEHTYR
jgi:3-methyl-2-oxobutanoate hydroxymethyltransferase